jgi:hypothetical protein
MTFHELGTGAYTCEQIATILKVLFSITSLETKPIYRNSLYTFNKNFCKLIISKAISTLDLDYIRRIESSREFL